MKKNVHVTLSESSYKKANRVANQRFLNKVEDPFEGKNRSLGIEYEQACAQKALHSYFKVKWKPLTEHQSQFLKMHLPIKKIIVRTTLYPNGFLAIHKSDPKDLIVVLAVVDRLPVVNLAGWCHAGDMKKQRFWKNDIHRPCFAVNQIHLNPMKELKTV